MTHSWNARALVVVSLFAISCTRSLELPPPPGPPTPGTLQGRLVVAQPGTTTRAPAKGAVVQLLSSSAGVIADDDGRFLIEGITKPAGNVLFRFDGDGDGQFEKQKSLTLQALKAGPGKSIDLGDVVLGENAQLRGRALLSDIATLSGHAGSVVFVPESPFAAITGDDGSFLLSELPEGEVRIGVYRQGYETVGLDNVTLSSGQELTLKSLLLVASPGTASQPGSLVGKAVLLEDGDLSTVSVTLRALSGTSTPATVNADGSFAFPSVPSGLYELNVSKPGFRTARITNLLLNPGEQTDVGNVALAVGEELPSLASDGGLTSDGGQVVGFGSPVAVVALNSVAATGKTARLDGSRSTDPAGTSLVYHWTQVPTTGEPSVTLSANHSLLAATPTFTAPSTPVQLHFTFTVTNALGLTSAPVNTVVDIVEPPHAEVTPAQVTVLPGATVVLDGLKSADPTGSTLSYKWTVTQGSLTLEALPGSTLTGPKVTLRAPSFEGGGKVTLQVSNGILDSDPLDIPVLVSGVGDGGSPVDIKVEPAQQFVSTGSNVSLSATVTGLDPSDTVTYLWQLVSPVETVITLKGDTRLTLGFVAPDTEQNLQFYFSYSASPSGRSGGMSVFVYVVDGNAPKIISSEPLQASGAMASPFSAWAEFDEALDPASVTPAHAMIRDADGGTLPADVEWNAQNRRVTVVPHTPLAVGGAYQLYLSGLTDTSAGKNALGDVTLDFTARAPTYTLSQSSSPSTVEPRPAIAVTQNKTWLLGRFLAAQGECGAGQDKQWIHYLDILAPDAGTLTELIPQTVSCLGTPVTQHRAATLGNDVHALLSYSSTPMWLWLEPVGFTSRETYNATTGPVGALVGDGSTVAGPFIQGVGPSAALHWRTLVNNSWVGAPSAPVDASFAYWADSEGAGGAVLGPRRLATGIVAADKSLRIFESVNQGPWDSITEASPTLNVAAVRSAYVGATPVVCFAHDVAGTRRLSCLVRNGSGWTTYAGVAQSVPSEGFDVATRGRTLWLSYSVAGQVRVKMLDLSAASPGFVTVNGHSGSTAWNKGGTSCTATRPEMAPSADGLSLTWQERCVGDEWRVILAKMQ